MKAAIIAIILSVSFLLPSSTLAATKEARIFVQVRESKLRSQPAFWSPSVADLSYGSALVAVGADPKNKSWIKAKLGETEGFVHVSAVTNKKVILSTNTSNVQRVADQSDVVMAGKGFNRQVENSYKTSKGLDFGAVDEVEKSKVDSNEGAAFVKEGKLIE